MNESTESREGFQLLSGPDILVLPVDFAIGRTKQEAAKNTGRVVLLEAIRSAWASKSLADAAFPKVLNTVKVPRTSAQSFIAVASGVPPHDFHSAVTLSTIAEKEALSINAHQQLFTHMDAAFLYFPFVPQTPAKDVDRTPSTDLSNVFDPITAHLGQYLLPSLITNRIRVVFFVHPDELPRVKAALTIFWSLCPVKRREVSIHVELLEAKTWASADTVETLLATRMGETVLRSLVSPEVYRKRVEQLAAKPLRMVVVRKFACKGVVIYKILEGTLRVGDVLIATADPLCTAGDKVLSIQHFPLTTVMFEAFPGHTVGVVTETSSSNIKRPSQEQRYCPFLSLSAGDMVGRCDYDAPISPCVLVGHINVDFTFKNNEDVSIHGHGMAVGSLQWYKKVDSKTLEFCVAPRLGLSMNALFVKDDKMVLLNHAPSACSETPVAPPCYGEAEAAGDQEMVPFAGLRLKGCRTDMSLMTAIRIDGITRTDFQFFVKWVAVGKKFQLHREVLSVALTCEAQRQLMLSASSAPPTYEQVFATPVVREAMQTLGTVIKSYVSSWVDPVPKPENPETTHDCKQRIARTTHFLLELIVPVPVSVWAVLHKDGNAVTSLIAGSKSLLFLMTRLPHRSIWAKCVSVLVSRCETVKTLYPLMNSRYVPMSIQSQKPEDKRGVDMFWGALCVCARNAFWGQVVYSEMEQHIAAARAKFGDAPKGSTLLYMKEKTVRDIVASYSVVNGNAGMILMSVKAVCDAKLSWPAKCDSLRKIAVEMIEGDCGAPDCVLFGVLSSMLAAGPELKAWEKLGSGVAVSVLLGPSAKQSGRKALNRWLLATGHRYDSSTMVGGVQFTDAIRIYVFRYCLHLEGMSCLRDEVWKRITSYL